jgi:flagellar L-ring protein FlgH
MKTKYASISKPVVLAALVASFAGTLEAGSLWTNKRSREAGMYADRRAGAVGDILSVMVQESASVQSSQRTKTDKTGNVDGSVESFFVDPLASGLGKHNGALPAMKMGGTTDFTGGGEITNKQTISARAAVTVIDVLPNGNLVIEGARYVSYSGERQYATLRGIVRPEDIQTGNTILSSSIADARVEFHSQGAITSAQRKGWFTRVADTLNPF